MSKQLSTLLTYMSLSSSSPAGKRKRDAESPTSPIYPSESPNIAAMVEQEHVSSLFDTPTDGLEVKGKTIQEIPRVPKSSDLRGSEQFVFMINARINDENDILVVTSFKETTLNGNDNVTHRIMIWFN